MKEVKEDIQFTQPVGFLGGVYGALGGDPSLGFRRIFFVLKAAAALYPYAYKSLKPYEDGVPRLYTTLSAANSQCVANRGDIIVLLPGHTETISTTVTLATAGTKIVGIGFGTDRPNITQGTTGSSGVLTITASNVWIENIYFTGSATGTNERFLIMATKGQLEIYVKNCVFEQKSKNLDAVTIAGITSATAVGYIEGITFDGCTFLGTVAGPDSGINILPMASHCVRNVKVIGCHFDYIGSAGVDDGCICVSLSGSATCTRMLVKDCTAMGLADGEHFLWLSPGAGSTGLVANCQVSAADATDVVIISNLLSFVNFSTAEPGKSAAVTKTLHPLATPAA